MFVQFGLAKLAELAINSASGAKNRRDNANRSAAAHGAALAWMVADVMAGDPVQAATLPASAAMHGNEIQGELDDAEKAEEPITNYYAVGIDESVDASEQPKSGITFEAAPADGDDKVVVNGQIVEIEEEED